MADLRGARASSAVVCPRRAVYQAQDAPRGEPTDEQRRWWRRGVAVEEAIVGDIVAELRAQGHRPRRQVDIPWPAADPIGVGHADLYVPHEAMIVEVTSTRGAELAPHKALQAALYARHHPRATAATVISVDPSSWEERYYPVDVSGLGERIEGIEAAVVRGVRGGELPERVCVSPWDGPARMCEHCEHCFEGWERPDPALLLGLDEMAVALADAEDALAAAVSNEARQRRDAARDDLRPHLPDGQTVQIGGIRLRRSVNDSERFSLAKARSAGHELPSWAEAFTSRTSSERWWVRRDGS